ncbi:nitrate- and nitrite sensing domain-containing protein [Streptomyces sp. NPDC048751]|uniref:sensor histidine kinase n=1 Tax=Streptomyces sp. NPDC048751 TaxID=3365591 RepID=UPI00371FEA7D
MQKTRPRRTGRQTAPEGGAERTPVGKGRPTHVRNRLIVAVAVVAAAIAGAGAPSVLAASGELKDSQDLVVLAEQTQDALALAHSLADERDEITSYIAAGRVKSEAPSEQRGARVDRQVEEMRADPDTPAAVRQDLDAIASVRRSALTGKDTALEAHQAYSATIAALHGLAEQLAARMPPRAGSGTYSLAELDAAVQQSAAARGLLLAALNVPTSKQTVVNPVTGVASTEVVSSEADTKQRDALSAAAQQARLRSDAALADFRDSAPKAAVTSYDSTVTGSDVQSADRYLASLTDQPQLSDDELGTDPKKLDEALSARVDAMRGVESSLFDHRTKDLEKLRDDDVTALEIRITALGVLMLVAVGMATGMARSLTRPLAVLRLGSARLAAAEDPVAEEPVKFTGRNDEFAQVVRSVNALHAHATALHERVTTLEDDRKHLVGQRQKMADAREELRAELSDSAAQLERLRGSIGGTFVNLALRTLGLVERQLAVIENLEEREQDPERLATLFKLDHFATVMRRHSENLLVLAGTEHVQQSAGPVPLVDVVRAAVSEIERYERVRIAALPPHAHIAGFAADDLSHLLAELMENATSFSPPDLPVEVSGWLLENGEVMLSVQDEGIGMAGDRLTRLNTRLAEFDPETPYDQEGEEGLGLGLYVVARLAHRHGVRVQLREQKQGGVAAVVVLPQSLLAAAPSAAVPSSSSSPLAGTTPAFSLPGADAEANSNVLPGRTTSGDPLVRLAEQTVRDADAADAESSGVAEEDVRESEGTAGAEGALPELGAAAEATEGAVGESPEAEDAVETAGDAREAVPEKSEQGQEQEQEPTALGTDPEPTTDAEPEAAPRAPERPAEMTMELLLPPQASTEPTTHEQDPTEDTPAEPEPPSEPAPVEATARERRAALRAALEGASGESASAGPASGAGESAWAAGEPAEPESAEPESAGPVAEEPAPVEATARERRAALRAALEGASTEPASAGPVADEPAPAEHTARERRAALRAALEEASGESASAGPASGAGEPAEGVTREPWADTRASENEPAGPESAGPVAGEPEAAGNTARERRAALRAALEAASGEPRTAGPASAVGEAAASGWAAGEPAEGVGRESWAGARVSGDAPSEHGAGEPGEGATRDSWAAARAGEHAPTEPGSGEPAESAAPDPWAVAARAGEHAPTGPGSGEPAAAPEARPAGAEAGGDTARERRAALRAALGGAGGEPAAAFSGPAGGGGEAEAVHERVPDEPEEVLTDKGLPKRTPKVNAPAPPPRQRTGSVDAEALRRRLGGFRRGAEAGYRDVEAEIAEQTGQNQAPPAPGEASSPAPQHAHAEEDTGGTVEEASS